MDEGKLKGDTKLWREGEDNGWKEGMKVIKRRNRSREGWRERWGRERMEEVTVKGETKG